MNFRDMNLRIFQGRPIPHVLFQPRFEPWVHWHMIFGLMPAAYQGMSVRDLYDHLGASMRYMHYYTNVPDPVSEDYSPEVKIREHFTETEGWRIYETPYGELTQKLKLTIDQEWREVEFLAKSLADLKALRWLIQRLQYSFSVEKYRAGEDFVGERGVAQFWVPKSPYQALAQVWMKLQHLVYALADDPSEVEETMKVIDASYDPLYEQICRAGVVKIINLGENLHEALFSHRYFEKYYLPWYEKRMGQLKQAGIFTHLHLDGYFHSLLGYLKNLPFDGLEALTPVPQGDVTLEEMKDAIGDKVLLDGIPAVLFMDNYTREQLMETAEKVIRLFAPRLVLGVSDEVPEGTGQEAIERVRMVAEYSKQYTFPMETTEVSKTSGV
jgi:hypothetical protein